MLPTIGRKRAAPLRRGPSRCSGSVPVVGWLDRLRKASDEIVLNLRENDRDASAASWRAWATEHGWTYQEDAPELIGRFALAQEKGAEHYHHLMTTTLHGFPVEAFEHRWHWHDGHNQQSHGSLRCFVAVRLPGYPPADATSAGAEATMRRLGGSVPAGYDLALEEDYLVANRTGSLDAQRLQGVAEMLTLQLAAVPASFWRPPGLS